jgi:Vacuolar segregation subunit 7
MSQNDHGTRNKLGARNGSHGVSGKKSMKFTTSAYGTVDGEHGSTDYTRGSARNGGSTPRHHHIGRYSRAVHPSLFDGDSPFTQTNKPASLRAPAGNGARLSRPNSPRVNGAQPLRSPRKGDMYPYDIDEDGADDERAPLIGSVRVNRNRHGRRPNSNLQQQYTESPEGCLSRSGTYFVITVLVFLLCLIFGTLVIALNRPLMDVSIKHIQNVLASKQEIMLDLNVRATNLNLFAITVNELDVNIFAESAYAGSIESWQREHDRSLSSWMSRRRQLLIDRDFSVTIAYPLMPLDSVDEGTDPIEDPDTGGPKMLLGRVLKFDSPLLFEASPLRRTPSSSVGEIRLTKPGNNTEAGGSERWERVLQHPFEIIVRGVIKYQLPFSSTTKSAKIGSRIKVLPEDETGGGEGKEKEEEEEEE